MNTNKNREIATGWPATKSSNKMIGAIVGSSSRVVIENAIKGNDTLALAKSDELRELNDKKRAEYESKTERAKRAGQVLSDGRPFYRDHKQMKRMERDRIRAQQGRFNGTVATTKHAIAAAQAANNAKLEQEIIERKRLIADENARNLAHFESLPFAELRERCKAAGHKSPKSKYEAVLLLMGMENISDLRNS